MGLIFIFIFLAVFVTWFTIKAFKSSPGEGSYGYGEKPTTQAELEERLLQFWQAERAQYVVNGSLMTPDRIGEEFNQKYEQVWDVLSYIAGEDWVKDRTGLKFKPKKISWGLALTASAAGGHDLMVKKAKLPEEIAKFRQFYLHMIENAAPKAPPELPESDGNLEARARLLSGQGIPIGYKDPLEPLTPLHYNGDRHLVTFGPIGTGKNTTSQTPALLEDDASALVIDVKGQLCAITAKRRDEMGHKVLVVNPFDVLGIPTATYNPLAHLDKNSLTFASDCQRIAEGLVDQKKADHWEMSALDVVGLLIMWVKLFEEDKSLVRVRQLLNKPEDERIELFEDIIERAEKAGIPALAEGAARYISDAKEVRDSIQTAVVQLGFMRDDAIARILKGGENEVSFAELKRRKMTAYVIIPPELLHTHGKFLRLLVMSALGELIRETTMPEKPVLFMLDEFAQLGPMSIIENAASIVRDYKIRLWIILQNLPQLKALYEQKWESFLSSAGVVQVFTPNDLETAEYFSRRSGMKKNFKRSESSSSSLSAQGVSSSQSTSYQEENEPVYRKEELWDMDTTYNFLLCAGLPRAIMARRLPYFIEGGLYQGLYEMDPYQMNTEERQAFESQARAGQWVVQGISVRTPSVSNVSSAIH